MRYASGVPGGRPVLQGNPGLRRAESASGKTGAKPVRRVRCSLAVTLPGSLSPSGPFGIKFMRDMLRGLHKFGTPAMCLGMVDVRDVAKAHVEAAIRPDAEGRFLLVADSKTFLEAGQILRERLGNEAHRARR